MKTTVKNIAVEVLFGLVSVACIAQNEYAPAGFTYATYY